MLQCKALLHSDTFKYTILFSQMSQFSQNMVFISFSEFRRILPVIAIFIRIGVQDLERYGVCLAYH